MSDEQRAGLALVLMVVVLMLWSRFYKPVIPQKPAATSPASANVQQPSAVRPGTANAQARGAQESGTPATTLPVKEATAERTITVESALYRVELSNRGGVVRSWKLDKYHDNEKPPKALELVNAAAAEQLKAWPLSIRLDDPKLDAEANSALYTVTPASGTLQAPAEVDFEWSDGHLQVSKELKFGPGYEMEVDVSATLDGKALPVGLAWRGGFGDQSVVNAPELVEVFYSENGKIEDLPYKKLGMKDHPEEPQQVNGYMEAAGIEDTFFTAAFLSDQPGGLTLWDRTQQYNATADGKTSQEPVVEMAAGSEVPGPWHARLYVGPKELTLLGKLKPRLTGLVQFGYMSFVAKPLLWALEWIHKYVPNYGWAIILLTLAINMALFPLKVKSWHSMKRMQKAMPRIKAIQEKYKKYSMRDPRRKEMNEEMSAIYKEEGANPIGGCLPQLIQMPIWFALYRMLQFSIELRHAPWIGWIHDLSARDPYFILPILMTVAMYYMMKMTPQTVTDPAQRKMMMFMPVAFGIFLFRYSSGLVLYIFTSNMVGILQQLYLNRNDPLPSNSPFKNKPAKA
ncbi:MAG TPA: membrane protein insertase YidC [Candidatus Limnocylindrales bacterium]|nr:membrane protein insertase YidC [Candidatus Limnocylindrales bacterium]